MTDLFMQNVRLLLRDLSARLPYGVVCEACCGEMRQGRLSAIDVADWDEDVRPLCDIIVNEETMETDNHEIDDLRPYLYPLNKAHNIPDDPVAYVGFCLEHHIDYLGLIDIGWAVEITKENNPYK